MVAAGRKFAVTLMLMVVATSQLAACVQTAKVPQPLQAYLDAWNKPEPTVAGQAVAALFQPDGTFRDLPARLACEGSANIANYVTIERVAFPDLALVPVKDPKLTYLSPDGTLGQVPYQFTGTNTGPSPWWQGVTGKKLSIQVTDQLQFRGGKIQQVASSYDGSAFLRQLGNPPPLPGNVCRAG